MLGKKSGLSYCDVQERYEHFRARCGKDNKKIELGCTDPVNKIKKKCVLFIIPKNHKCKSFNCY